MGLAAGFDTNGVYLSGLAKLGFAFIEVGGVTPLPQRGNPQPRIFRLPEQQAIINRMGFSNQGVDALVANIKKSHYQGILGVNIGKNKDTPLNKAGEDYRYCLQRIYPYASYVTINISSPNTPDLRQLQQKEYFADLMSLLREEQLRLAQEYQRFVPLVVKISPDEEDENLKAMTEVMLRCEISGIIATNTTGSREGVTHLVHGNEQGGLSGKPLRQRATHCLHLMHSYVGDQITLIGLGGIDDVNVAQEKKAAGATLLQVYTGLIYQGPGLIARLAAA